MLFIYYTTYMYNFFLLVHIETFHSGCIVILLIVSVERVYFVACVPNSIAGYFAGKDGINRETHIHQLPTHHK